ncbi:LOW QUALITY PROTEIN: bromodomain adjacent to zinc finger domain protein 2B-like [Amphiura filiformis]|uniref:LOW QUALITY PROTEIN: bromodomain adjacent to zinc finger domain protein 2B-like n=1 Tax=Amphiura filiformis TaxID=82378 RepID=UPI003B21C148
MLTSIPMFFDPNDPGANPWWQHAAAAHSMAGLGHEFYASQLGAAAASPTFGLAAAAAAAAAAGKEETSSSPGFESLLGQIKSPKVAKPSPTGSSGSKASTSTSRRGRQRKPDYRPSSLSPPATSTSIPQSPPPSSLSSPKKEGVSVIREVPEDPSTSSPSSSHLPRSSTSISTSSISTKTIATPTTSLSSSRKKTEQRPAASSESNSDDDDDDDIAESDSNQSDVSSGDDSGSDSDPDSDDKELANLIATKKQLEAQQREILHQKALEMLRKKQFGHSHKSSKKRRKEKLLKQKHIAHEQELREQEQKRRAAELTLHFEQQIKQQQQQLRLQKKAQADKEKTEGETSESGEKRKSSSARYSRKEERQMEKTSQDNTPIALDMSKKPRKAMDEDEQPLALNLKVNKKLFKPEFSHAQVNGKPETVSAFSSAAASPTPSSKSNATDTPAVARFRDVDSEADSEKATNEKAAESDEEESEDSDDSQEVSSDSDGDEGEEEEEEEESDSDEEPGSKAETDGDSARDSESSPVPGRVPLLTKRQLIESMIEVPDTNPRKRMRVTDDEAVRHPLDHGWRRQIVIRQLGPGDRVKGDVIYYAPCGKKLRTYPEVMRYIERRGITTVAREHFSFSAKIRVGEFLNPKPGENGIVFEKLSEEELQNRIDILCNRKPRNVRQVKAAERKRITQELARRSAMVKHQKKLEQQEMARRIAEAKMRRKMERQAHQQAQREARRQQALQMAEAKKREKDHRRILKEQEKMARMQQLRLEREMRNHQIIEERRKKKMAAEHQKAAEAMEKAKEREIRRQQAVLMKHQERERRKQHMMLVRALEARKKAEEKERAKQHKKQDKRALKEKRFQQEQMELTLARELKKPVEDMKLYDEDRPLPELTQMKNVRLTGSAYADCLMVIEFLHNFGETLGLDDDDIPTMGILQAGLFNDQEHIDEVITLTVQLLSMAVDDPGLPGELNTTSYGEKLDDVIVTENNMSEILRLFMTRTNGKEDELSSSLIRMPYRALSATEKASILAFLVNQLVCNQTVMQQIDIEMNKVADLRRDKWVVEGKVRKLRVLQSKKFGRKSTPKKNSSEPGTSTPKSDQSKPNMDKTPAGEDDDDDETKDGDDDDDETRDIDDDDEEDGGGEEGGAVEEEEEEDDGITVEEIQKKIERLQKQHSQFRHKIFDAHHIARATTFGQDRFKRRFWVLPHAGGIYVEGMESGDLSEQDKKNIKAEVKMEVKLEKDVKEEEEKEEEIKKEKDECKKEEDCDDEKKDSVEKEPQADVAGSSYVTQNGDQTASTSQEVSLQSQNNLFRTDDIERTMDKDEIERKFNRDLEGLIEMGLSTDDNKKPEQGTKFDEFEESMEKKDEDERKEEAKMDVAESETIATHNGLVVQNGPTDLSKHGARRTPTPTHYEQTEKDKQGHEQDTPLSLEPKREVLTPTLSKSSTPTPSKVSTPSHISTPGSSTRDVSSPSLSDTKSGFMSLDSILHRGTPQPYVLANPYAAATSAASPVISEHLLKGVDSKPNGSLGTWFSILPRMPCDDESLTRTQTSNDSSSSDQQIAAELKHNAAAMPFNVSPYGLYQMPFPLMHMNQMNPLVGAYAAFPGFGAVPLQAVAGMNGPLDLSNPMMSVVSSSSSPQPQQDVKPDIKMEIKKEEDEDDEDERESIAIAQMKSMLDKIESAAEQLIPEDLRDGWWQITSIEQLRLLMRNLQPRGIRERVLQKTLQKYVDFCEKSMKKGISDYVQIEDKEDDEDAADASSSSKKKEVKSEDMVKDVVFTCNRKMVESIEEMEEKVYCASMQVKGWTLPDKVSCEPFFESYEAAETSGSNLLNISIRRLEALEKAVERRYLKPPLTRRQSLLMAVQTTGVDTSSQVSTPRGEDDIAPGLVRWRNAVAAATSASQLCLCLGMLENCIAWDKSIMKVFCQLCRKGDNEALLLLCDGCDKGFHTYCFKPKMEKIPEGDWYCSVCVSKATGEPGTCIECQKTGKLLKCNQCPRSYHLNCLNPQLSKMPRGKWMCPPCEKIKRKAEKKKKKHKKSKHKEKEKGESGRSTPASIPGSPADTPKSETKHVSKKHKDNMAPCKQMVSELDKEENSWPFLLPVNTKQFTSYRKIIKKPMDLSTLRNKMHNGSCRTHEEFAADVRLMFDNCETYNEDESEVGQAGHAMRAFFEKRWPEVLKEYGYLVAT